MAFILKALVFPNTKVQFSHAFPERRLPRTPGQAEPACEDSQEVVIVKPQTERVNWKKSRPEHYDPAKGETALSSTDDPG